MLSLEHPDITYAITFGPHDEPRTVSDCEYCGDDIIEGDEAYNIPGVGMIHDDCLRDYFYQYKV